MSPKSISNAATSACNHCGAPATLRCSACQQVAYCSRKHQQANWSNHKPACLHSRKSRDSPTNWDKHVPKDGYVGTLRWGPETTFRPLPEFRKGMVPSLRGWEDFFASRLDGGSENEEGKVVLDPQMIDGLSFPLSFLWALRQLLVMKAAGSAEVTRRKKLVVGALGASDRAEERLLSSTNYWQEIGHMFPGSHVELWLVGPEMSRTGSGKIEDFLKNMTVCRLRGTSAEFLERFKGDHPVIIGFNTGFGSGDQALKESWKGDLQRILELNLLAIFTCANDYHDLKCEREIWEKELHARYVLYPRKNPFAAVTTTHLPGRQNDTWASANSYVYAIQGSRKEAELGTSPASLSKTTSVPHSEAPGIEETSMGSSCDSAPVVTIGSARGAKQGEAEAEPGVGVWRGVKNEPAMGVTDEDDGYDVEELD